ncbi:MAG: SurA N-terminal domain-containing protein [Bacteroidales bacterium]|jgi:peptidyl-prolyl cis-trans isomerase D|nr:SurA N-terminal domain-containing protein [Bacteroidales bacterium]
MSALQFLREKAGVLVVVIIGVSLLLFVVSDFFGNGQGMNSQARKYYEIGQIGDETVSYQDYEGRVQNLYEIYKLSGTSTIDEATSESIREQTWQQLIREKILSEQYEKLGIDVSEEEVDDLVLGNNPHPVVLQLFTDQQTGSFNKSFLINFLKQTEVDETAKRYWLFFEDEIVNDRMNTKYNTMIAKGLYVTSKQVEYDQKLSANSVDFSFIGKNYSTISDSLITITQSEINQYYEKHKESFRRTALRDVEYVTFDVVPSEEDIRQAEEWIDRTKTEFAEASDPVQFINLTADSRHNGFFVPIDEIPDSLVDFVVKEDTKDVFGPWYEDGSYKIARLIAAESRPDSVHARHILLSPDQTRSLADVRQQADSLKSLIRSGVSFESLAMSVSDDQGSAQLGGDLGWFSEGMMVLPFNNACFSARKGELVTAETTFGIHLIEILDQSRTTKKYHLGIVDRKVIAGSATNQRIYSEASHFAGTNNTYEKFNSAIAENRLEKRIASNVTPQQKTLPGLDNSRSLVISLFQTDKEKIVLDNSEQAVFEIGDKYVVAYCTKIQEEGIAPVRDVENEIRFALVRDKKAELIAADFKKTAGEGQSIDNIARSMGLTVQDAAQVGFESYTIPGAGSEQALIAAASAAKQGVVSGPVKGNDAVYMLVVNNLTEGENEDPAFLRERLSATYQMRGNYEAYEALRKDANIVDKRYKFY